MKKVSPLLPFLILALSGCAHHEENKDPRAEWQRRKEADEDRQFFYGGWLNPNANEPEARTIPVPAYMEH